MSFDDDWIPPPARRRRVNIVTGLLATCFALLVFGGITRNDNSAVLAFRLSGVAFGAGVGAMFPKPVWPALIGAVLGGIAALYLSAPAIQY